MFSWQWLFFCKTKFVIVILNEFHIMLSFTCYLSVPIRMIVKFKEGQLNMRNGEKIISPILFYAWHTARRKYFQFPIQDVLIQTEKQLANYHNFVSVKNYYLFKC